MAHFTFAMGCSSRGMGAGRVASNNFAAVRPQSNARVVARNFIRRDAPRYQHSREDGHTCAPVAAKKRWQQRRDDFDELDYSDAQLPPAKWRKEKGRKRCREGGAREDGPVSVVGEESTSYATDNTGDLLSYVGASIERAVGVDYGQRCVGHLWRGMYR
jgi:hypothetical protein